MIRNNQQRRSNNYFKTKRQSFILNSAINNRMNRLRNQTDSNKTSNDDREISKPEPKTKWTDIVGIAINFILAVATFMLYKEATRQSGISEQAAIAAKKSADAATAAVNLQRQSLISTEKANKDAYELNKSTFDASNEANKKALQQQIQSLKETQKNFKIENRPFIQVAQFSIDTTFANETIKVAFKYVNVGKFPAKIYFSKARVAIGTDTSRLDFKGDFNTENINDFLASNIVEEMTETLRGIPVFWQNQIKLGLTNIYVFIETSYGTFGVTAKYHSNLTYEISYKTGRQNTRIINNDAN